MPFDAGTAAISLIPTAGFLIRYLAQYFKKREKDGAAIQLRLIDAEQDTEQYFRDRIYRLEERVQHLEEFSRGQFQELMEKNVQIVRLEGRIAQLETELSEYRRAYGPLKYQTGA